MESIDQGATTDSHVEGSPIVDVEEEFTTYDNPLIEQPPTADTAFHFLMEGRAGSLDWVATHPIGDAKEE